MSLSWLESDRARDLVERAGLSGLPPGALKAVLLFGAALVCVGVWRFWPRAPEPEIPFTAEEAVPQAPEETPVAEADVVVHVAGAVAHPGVYELDAGSRVADAIQVAGGGTGDAALEALNLARILSDGEQVYVPTLEQVASGSGPPVAAAGGSSGGTGSADTVNINTASASELENLPGVGPATAQKIVDDREANGPYSAPEDLMRVPGIGEKKFESLREFVVCG